MEGNGDIWITCLPYPLHLHYLSTFLFKCFKEEKSFVEWNFRACFFFVLFWYQIDNFTASNSNVLGGWFLCTSYNACKQCNQPFLTRHVVILFNFQARENLETLLANIKGSNIGLEEKLTIEALNRTQRERELNERKGLWESEVKSRSMIGVKVGDKS